MTKIIYLCGNDGTDTRVSKELSSYSKKNTIYFIGVKGPKPFIHNTVQHKLFFGSHKNIFTIISMNIFILILYFRKFKFDKVHVVDEQFYFFFIPLLSFLRIHITLDVFDSIFLKKNYPNNKAYLLKKYIYGSADKIIVTDKNRFKMLPDFSKEKAIIIPNVPFKNIKFQKIKPTMPGKLTIAYFGTLLKNRGSEFVEKIIQTDKSIKFLLAGWIGDDYTKNLISKYSQSIKYYGVITQDEANELLFNESNFILCIYPFNNLNNIYASPNKIYDAILTKTPVIMNSEIKVSNFIQKFNLGYIFNFSNLNFQTISEDLINKKDSYSLNNSISNDYCWEKYEPLLNS